MSVWSAYPARRGWLDERSFRAQCPRAGEPWRVSEDRRLLRVYDELVKDGHRGYDLANALASKMKRTGFACLTRVMSLRAGDRLCRARRRSR